MAPARSRNLSHCVFHGCTAVHFYICGRRSLVRSRCCIVARTSLATAGRIAAALGASAPRCHTGNVGTILADIKLGNANQALQALVSGAAHAEAALASPGAETPRPWLKAEPASCPGQSQKSCSKRWEFLQARHPRGKAAFTPSAYPSTSGPTSAESGHPSVFSRCGSCSCVISVFTPVSGLLTFTTDTCRWQCHGVHQSELTFCQCAQH